MPFLAGVFSAISAGFAALGITAQTILGILFNVGLQLIQMLLNKPPKPDDIQQVYRQSVPERVVHAGKLRVGGPFMFLETKNRVLWMIIYLGQGVVDGFEEFFLDSRSILQDKTGWVTSKPYHERNIIRIETRVGNARSTAYKLLMNAFRGVVTAKWRGDGLATAMLSCDSVGSSRVAKIYPNRIPTFNAIARFSKPYDPRTGTSKWTSNLPLLLLYYLTHEDGANISRSLIDLDDFKEAANVADVLLPTKDGGSARRYHGSLSWKMTEKPKDVINRLLMAMDGRLFLKPSGKIGFKVGKWYKPRVHIEDIHILMADLADSSSPIQEANEIVIKWTNPLANYTPTTSDPWVNRAQLKKAGGAKRNSTLELYSIDNHNHARRVAKIMDKKLNPKWQGTIITDLTAIEAWDQRFITITYEDLDIENQPFEILQIGLDEEELTIEMTVASVDEDLYDFDPETEEGSAPINPDSLGEENIPAIENFVATADIETVNGVREVNVDLSVKRPKRNKNDDDDDDLLFEFQYSRANQNRWHPVGGPREDHRAEVRNLKDGGRYDFRVRLRAGDGAPGDWSIIEDFEIIGNKKPPDIPKNIVARRTDSREVTVTATAPNQDRFAAFRLYRNNKRTSRGAKLIATEYGAQGTSFTVVDDNVSAGLYYYYVASINFSGRESARKPARNNPIRVPK